jgi:plasmid stabilization system protein ParE
VISPIQAGTAARVDIVSRCIVIYRHTKADGTVDVVRIVHGSRRITGKLLRGTS